MFKILVFLVISYLTCTILLDSSTNDTYYVPCNIGYPFGDEKQIDIDMLDNQTRTIHNGEEKHLQDLHGKCPYQQINETLVDPHTLCPGPDFSLIPPPDEILFSSSNKQTPKVQCKKCDLRLTPDNTAVLLECFQCFDIPSTCPPANRTERNILYKVSVQEKLLNFQ
ncbi:hypothetical protein JTB14_013390 [Gonioctena quinquepunctata]|nr:hypothetical protein JTB14_013390 [Gonioctena quinquepunctata]